MVQLKYNEFISVVNFFSENKYQIPALAVLNGNFPGRVFVDNRDKPEIVIVWAISRWSYIACKILLPEHRDFISDVFNKEIIPIIKEVGEERFEFYADNNIKWDTVLNESLQEYQICKHYENTFVLNKERFETFASTLEVYKDIEVCEKAYPIISKEYQKYVTCDEVEKKVFVMAIEKNGKILSQCLNNGFVHGDNYFIDLDTFDNQERNKGYGTLISCSLISNQLKKGLLPLWETTVDNLPSQRVANKLGFEIVDEYPVYSIAGF